MRKIKSKFLTICALFLATITCTAFGVFASIDNKEEITVAKAENVEVILFRFCGLIINRFFADKAFVLPEKSGVIIISAHFGCFYRRDTRTDKLLCV